jgi:hypothetical protein
MKLLLLYSLLTKSKKYKAMKKLIIISVLFLSYNCFAQNGRLNKINDKLYYEDFIDQYGGNDTSRAIIDIFFDKKEYSATGKMSFLPLSAGITIVSPPLGIGLLVVSTPLFISGVITRRKYSQKNLLKTLTEYNESKTMAKNIKRKVNLLLLAELEIQNEQISENRFAILQSIRQTYNSQQILVIK